MVRMERVIPLIPPATVGPLGVPHLPRAWLKGILSAADMLPDDYFAGYRGFNKFLCDGIGLDPDAFFAYLGTVPTYPETERWVRANATTLNTESVAEFNTFVTTFERPGDGPAAIRERVGLADESLRISSALINLDDWFSMHEFVVAHRDDELEPLYPTISSGAVGPLGITHLPRLWIKALLAAVGALPHGWNSGFGYDKRVADAIGLDLDAACAFIRADLPTYLQFEAWVATQIPPADEATRAAVNAMTMTRQKPAENAALERAEAGVPEQTFCDATLLNDMLDWKQHHDRVVERRVARS